jgi:diguanylate cyclase (GGDEF)-like protein
MKIAYPLILVILILAAIFIFQAFPEKSAAAEKENSCRSLIIIIFAIFSLILVIHAIIFINRIEKDSKLLKKANSLIENQRSELKEKLSDMQEAEKQIEHLSTHDSLTGLTNRHFLNESFGIMAAAAKRNEKKLALLYIDLDDFGLINNELGHMAGDDILCNAAEQFKRAVRGSDIVARVGGDEFAVLIDLQHEDDAATVAKKIQDNLELSCSIKEKKWSVSASIGISLYPGHGSNLNEIMKKANAAMNKIKNYGKKGYAFWEEPTN